MVGERLDTMEGYNDFYDDEEERADNISSDGVEDLYGEEKPHYDERPEKIEVNMDIEIEDDDDE